MQVREASERALLIIDMQVGFMNEHTEHLVDLINRKQREYDHVFATQFYNAENSGFTQVQEWDEMKDESDDNALAISPAPHCVVVKNGSYQCLNPEIQGKLSDEGIKEVDICGVETDQSIQATAFKMSADKLFTPYIKEKYCASRRGEEYHNHAISVIEGVLGPEQVDFNI